MIKKLVSVACDRCGGKGGSDAWKYTGVTCYKCGGSGQVDKIVVERTEVEQARYDERKAKSLVKQETALTERKVVVFQDADRQAKYEAAYQAKKEELDREAYARRTVGYVGDVGEKINIVAKALHLRFFERTCFNAPWNKETVTMYFYDTPCGVIVWKTVTNNPDFEIDAVYNLTATVKCHSMYGYNEQTEVIRVKTTRREV